MKRILVAISAATGICSPAQADEQSYPKISGELSIEIENDWTYSSDDAAVEFYNLYPTVILGTTVEFTPTISLNFEATAEPVEDTTEDSVFKDVGGYINIITANYDTDRFSVYAGKFTANFGVAWDIAPGIYGVDLNEDYELSEMIGFGGGINFNAAGSHTISASTFFQDTGILSKSIGNQRGPLELSDGGPANTDDLSSYVVALDGEFENLAGFRYNIGFSSLSAGEGGNDRQYGYVVGAEYAFGIGEEIVISPMAEFAYFNNAGGLKNDTAKYLTTGIALNYENWIVSTTYQRRDTETAGIDLDDTVFDVRAGYVFDMGLGVAAAWRLAEEGTTDSKALGLLLSYAIDF